MARLRADDLDRLADLLGELRAVEALSERGPATFARGRAPFLHFHSLQEGLVADLKVGSGWRRYPADRAADRRIVLRDARRILRGDVSRLAGRPT
jgi:hypothetical protein